MTSFGYRGPLYCRRCFETMRDHLQLQKSNSAQCTRDKPCSDCQPMLQNFACGPATLFARFDSKQSKRGRTSHSAL